MKYAILIYDENTVNPDLDPDPVVWGQVMTEYNAFTKAINDAGVNLGGEALQPNPTATSVRVRDGKTVTTDGPFAETKEGLGGFYILDCKTSTRPWPGQQGAPAPGMAPSRCARS